MNLLTNIFVKIIVITLSVLALLSNSSAIVVTDDPAYHEFDYTSDFNGVGYLSSAGGTTGVLVSPNCILTAAHAVTSISGHTFTLDTPSGPESFNLVEKFVNALTDLAIVRLDRNTGLSGYEINTQLNEVGNEIIIVGFGSSGVGGTQTSTYPRGVGRYGTNTVDQTFAGFLVYDFDEPHGQGTTDGYSESMVTSGDSGGPSFMWIDGIWKIVGIHTGASDYDGDGILSEYGDNGYDARLVAYESWITNTIQEFLLGDANRDGIVSAGDYGSVQINFGNTGEPGIPGDANLDGIVSAGDYGSVQINFGNTSSVSPEPTTIFLISAGFILVCFKKRVF